MKKTAIIAMLILSVFLVSCMKESPPVQVKTPTTANEQIPTTQPEQQETQLANPASVYCEKQGGTLEIKSDEKGQYGMCHLPDGTDCEEWAFYRGECKSLMS